MNFSFTSPWYLLGLLGLALPILIHLLTRRQQTRLKFSAVYLLQQAKKRSVRKSRPNKLLLLLLRCLAIGFLCLALANPILSSGDLENILTSRPSAHVFILDDSYSMSATSDQGTLFNRATQTLTELIEKLPGNHSFSLVLASNPSRMAQNWTSDKGSALKWLKAAQPSHRTTSIGRAVTVAVDLLSTAPQENKRIFILTDMDQNGWNRDEFPSALAEDSRTQIKIIDFSKSQKGLNRALVQRVKLNQEFLTNRRVIRVQATITNLLSDRAIKQLPISLFVNGKRQSESMVDLPAKGEATHEFSFPLLNNDPVTGHVEIQEDALMADNKRLFAYQPNRKIKALVVDGDPRGVAHQHDSFYVEKALNPFSSPMADIEPTVSTLSEFSEQDLKQYSVIILCNVRDMAIGLEQELEKFVLRGGALFIGLGDQVDPKYYNEKLGLLLPVTLKSINQIRAKDKPFHLKAQPSNHPALKVFSGNMLKEMGRIPFRTLYSVEPRRDRTFEVPMHFTNQFPAVIESNFGEGKVILFVSSLDRDWNNFPIHPTFLPWIQRWVKYSAQGLENISRHDITVSTPLVLEEMEQPPLVVAPGGKVSIARKKPQSSPVFDDTHRPGVYDLYQWSGASTADSESAPAEAPKQLPADARRLGSFTVNFDPAESAPGKVPEKELAQYFPGAQVDYSPADQALNAASVGNGVPLTTLLFLLLAVMMFWEGWIIRKE
ncbi:MAG: BatA domain-containing protein [Nitrospinota bacterium]|nr:BatA domain-containing protein [Nitrospinota bacterium]